MRKIHNHLHNFFIPHEGNDHLPHSVRHKSLHTYAGILIGLKALLVAMLFVSFPSIAQFSVITQSRITELVNQSRVEQGLQKVTVDPTLQKAAELKLQDMINEGYFAHTSPDGEVPWKWFKEAGYLYTYAGENLAMNFSEAENAHDAWMASPTHRANILNSNYNEIGVAVGVGEIDGEQATLVVQLFGTSFVPPTIAQQPTQPIPRVQGEEVVVTPEPISQAEPITEPATELETPAVEPQPEAGAPIAQKPAAQQPELTAPVEAPLPTERVVVPIDTGAASQQVMLEKPAKPDTVGYILRFVKNFYWLILGFVVFALMLKIIIRVRIQHKKVIAHGMFVVAVGFLLLAIHLHFLEAISGPVLIF